jgi:hypothetical protein
VGRSSAFLDDGAAPAAGVVGRAAAVQPEGGVGEGAGVDPRSDLESDHQAPVGPPPVELSQLGEGEGRPDPQPQLVADRVDDRLGPAPLAAVVPQRLQGAPAVFPLEERVVEAGVGYFLFFFFLTLKVVVSVVLLPATSVTVIVSR